MDESQERPKADVSILKRHRVWAVAAVVLLLMSAGAMVHEWRTSRTDSLERVSAGENYRLRTENLTNDFLLQVELVNTYSKPVKTQAADPPPLAGLDRVVLAVLAGEPPPARRTGR